MREDKVYYLEKGTGSGGLLKKTGGSGIIRIKYVGK